ncbi:MAG TPA: hypothetical protein H9687_06760 [Firmicutes bacterium]|nr:hypothetical protein [Bacillota bacterium]
MGQSQWKRVGGLMAASALFFLGLRFILAYSRVVREAVEMLCAGIWSVLGALDLQNETIHLLSLPRDLLLTLGLLAVAGIGWLLLWQKETAMKAMKYILTSQTVRVLRLGLRIYLARWALILLFGYSVIGAPAALGFFCLSVVLDLVFAVPFVLLSGEWIVNWYGGSDRRPSPSYWVGALLMIFAIRVPFMGVTLVLFVLPILSTGTAAVYLEEKWQNTAARNKVFDRRSMRQLILQGEEEKQYGREESRKHSADPSHRIQLR